MTISAYSTTPGSNTSINGIPVGPGMPRVNVDDVLQNLMADIKSWTVTYGVSIPVTIAQGGTGATTAATAFTALAASGGTMGSHLKRESAGVYTYWANPGATVGGKFYLQGLGGPDPTVNPYDIVFEY
jgi:hypothetical protein